MVCVCISDCRRVHIVCALRQYNFPSARKTECIYREIYNISKDLTQLGVK